MSVRKLVRRLLVPAALAAAASCYPGGPGTEGELDVVATLHAASHDYSVNKTYAMPDTVVDLAVAGGGSSSLSHTYDAKTLADINASMQSLGYTRVDGTTTKGDVILLVGGISVDHTDVWYPSYPWGGWWGWYYPYPCPGCVPIYPWVPVATQYSTGTIVITMIQPSAPHASDQVPVVWAATINGLLTGSDASIQARIDYLIPQAFAQSPYLSVK